MKKISTATMVTLAFGATPYAQAHDLHLSPLLEQHGQHTEKQISTPAPAEINSGLAAMGDESSGFRQLGEELISTLSSIVATPAEAVGNARITVKGNYRFIKANGIPNHATGKFPSRGNPHAIRAQNYNFRVALNPKKNAKPTTLGRRAFGVAINGIPFDPGTAEFFQRNPRSPWRGEAITASGKGLLGLDQNKAHVQPNGAYHYHGIPSGLLAKLGSSKLIGYAADGFPIYYTGQKSGYRLKSGRRPKGANSPGGNYDGTYSADYVYTGGSLDQCNGTTGKTKEYPDGTYYYVVTANFPFYPRCFMGTPDASFKQRNGPPPGAQRMGNNKRPLAGQNAGRPRIAGARPPRPGFRRPPPRP